MNANSPNKKLIDENKLSKLLRREMIDREYLMSIVRQLEGIYHVTLMKRRIRRLWVGKHGQCFGRGGNENVDWPDSSALVFCLPFEESDLWFLPLQLNFAFLFNIVRVLITKLRAVNSPDTNQTK